MVDHSDIDHTGLTGISSGAVATDTIWDAAGDLAVGSGANTAAKLAIGSANGMSVQRVSGAVAWAYPPQFELSRVEYTSNVTINQSAEGSAVTVVTAAAIAFDGSTACEIEFFCPSVSAQATAGVNVLFYLSDGGTNVGILARVTNPASSAGRWPVRANVRLTPSNATHTYSIEATSSSGTSTAEAGNAVASPSAATFYPGYIRITRV